jgi:hypothetical protein
MEGADTPLSPIRAVPATEQVPLNPDEKEALRYIDRHFVMPIEGLLGNHGKKVTDAVADINAMNLETATFDVDSLPLSLAVIAKEADKTQCFTMAKHIAKIARHTLKTHGVKLSLIAIVPKYTAAATAVMYAHGSLEIAKLLDKALRIPSNTEAFEAADSANELLKKELKILSDEKGEDEDDEDEDEEGDADGEEETTHDEEEDKEPAVKSKRQQKSSPLKKEQQISGGKRKFEDGAGAAASSATLAKRAAKGKEESDGSDEDDGTQKRKAPARRSVAGSSSASSSSAAAADSGDSSAVAAWPGLDDYAAAGPEDDVVEEGEEFSPKQKRIIIRHYIDYLVEEAKTNKTFKPTKYLTKAAEQCGVDVSDNRALREFIDGAETFLKDRSAKGEAFEMPSSSSSSSSSGAAGAGAAPAINWNKVRPNDGFSTLWRAIMARGPSKFKGADRRKFEEHDSTKPGGGRDRVHLAKTLISHYATHRDIPLVSYAQQVGRPITQDDACVAAKAGSSYKFVLEVFLEGGFDGWETEPGRLECAVREGESQQFWSEFQRKLSKFRRR